MSIHDKLAASANPNRGYHNYDFEVTFEVDEKGSMMTEEGQQEYMKMFHDKLKDKQYMWCYAPKRLSEVKGKSGWQTKAVWVINYGYDSGD